MRGLPAAVVFDVDGTLVDSERHGHRVAFNDAFSALDLPYRWGEEEYGRLLEVAGGRQRLRAFLLDRGHPAGEADDLAARLHALKTDLFLERCKAGQVPARPGAARLLDELAGAGVTLTVATTGSGTWVQPLLERLFGLERFRCVLTASEVPRRKPDPDVYRETLRRLDLPPGEVVVVEDSDNGLAAARAAGLACLVVVNDYTRAQSFPGAALIVDGFGDPGRATVLHGAPGAVVDGAVRPATVAHVLEVGGRDRIATGRGD